MSSTIQNRNQPSQEEFLVSIFGQSYLNTHVCGFLDDPTNISNDRRGLCWAGGYYSDYKNKLRHGENHYFCISHFFPDFMECKAVRRKSHFLKTYVIVADDVEEKLELAQVEKLPLPTYKLRTSKSSYQWGWVLKDPESNADRVNNLLDQLIKNGLSSDGSDPGMKGVTRLVRLPGGFNTKKKRIAENNGIPPECLITEWNPESRYEIEDLARPFKVDLDAPRADVNNGNLVEANSNPIFNIIKIKSTKQLGTYDVSCPWLDEHSDNDDSGSAIFTYDDGHFGFKCHHGHCEGKTSKDVLHWLELTSPEAFSAYQQWKTQKMFESVQSASDESLASINTKLIFKKTDYSSLPYIEWVIKGFIPKGFQCFSGLPGIGKSTIFASLAMIVAGYGVEIESSVIADRKRIIIYVSEDTEQLERQFFGYCQQYKISPEDLENQIKLVDAKRCSINELAHELKNLVGEVTFQIGAAPLIVLDTASSLFDIDNENDNSQVARFIANLKNQIYESIGCPVWLITHAAKTSSKNSGDITPRGASAFMGDVTGTGSIYEQNEEKIFELGKIRVAPEFDQIRFETVRNAFFTRDDRGQAQAQSILLAIPQPSIKSERAKVEKERKVELINSEMKAHSLKLITYIDEQISLHRAVIIKYGSGGNQNPPKNINAKQLTWRFLFDEVLVASLQSHDEKVVKNLVTHAFQTEDDTPAGWHLWRSRVQRMPKVSQGLETFANQSHLNERGEHQAPLLIKS